MNAFPLRLIQQPNPSHIMKHSHWTAVMAAAVALSSQIGPASAQNGKGNGLPSTIPAVPLAVFSANPSIVQTGTYPTLTWSITYPSKVSDVATITAPGVVTLNTPMYVSVRPVGVGVTQSGRGDDISTIHSEARISINGSSYQQLFYGTNTDVNPSTSLYIKKLTSGTTIDFGGRYVIGNEWTPFYTTKSSNMQVITLANGDTLPTSVDLAASGTLASYLKPYINYVNGQGIVNIGPMNVLVLMELAEKDHGNSRFDYQDVVLLVNFASKHPNNGHGNNLDGVDSSNPGKGSGGPNGEVDPSGGVDDERR